MKALLRTTFWRVLKCSRSRLTEEARRVTGNGTKFFEVLPGVRETLEALAEHPRYRVGAGDWKHRVDGATEDGTGWAR